MEGKNLLECLKDIRCDTAPSIDTVVVHISREVFETDKIEFMILLAPALYYKYEFLMFRCTLKIRNLCIPSIQDKGDTDFDRREICVMAMSFNIQARSCRCRSVQHPFWILIHFIIASMEHIFQLLLIVGSGLTVGPCPVVCICCAGGEGGVLWWVTCIAKSVDANYKVLWKTLWISY